MPLCHTAPDTAFLGAALQKITMNAAAAIITIWMMMFMASGFICATPSITLPVGNLGRMSWPAICVMEKNTMTARAPRKMNTARFASLETSLSSTEAVFPNMYSFICGSLRRAWNAGSLSRSSPRLYETAAAAMIPQRHAGIVIAMTCRLLMLNPFAFEIITNETTAAAIGEQVIPTCDATEATPQGRSGRIPFLSEISHIIGMRV